MNYSCQSTTAVTIWRSHNVEQSLDRDEINQEVPLQKLLMNEKESPNESTVSCTRVNQSPFNFTLCDI